VGTAEELGMMTVGKAKKPWDAHAEAKVQAQVKTHAESKAKAKPKAKGD
jgi:hypothetical protein